MKGLQNIWHQAYKIVPEQLQRVQEVGRVVTAFNTNIDAIVKISGSQLTRLAQSVGLGAEDLRCEHTRLNTPKDVVRGIIKCFSQGIAEEWLCENHQVYEWIRHNLPYARLQMGGQAGIVANVMAVLGAKEVCAHTSSHPQLQAEQFLDLPNLLAINQDGAAQKACTINRPNDEPLLHWIMEFSAGDVFELAGQKYVCPKANRFIATYDNANLELRINGGFLQYLANNTFDYMILSGYHNLQAENGGVERIVATIPLLQTWKKANPQAIIHLELASTQDKIVRKEIVEKIAPAVDSVGLNEREALDVLEIVAPQMYAAIKNTELSAPLLCNILLRLKQKMQTPRIQLHCYGLYLTLQDKGFAISPQANKRGMMLAAAIAASKAGTGNIESKEKLLWAQDMAISDAAVKNMAAIAEFLQNPMLAESGLAEMNGFDLIAVPTIIIDKPKTLVGMGDTISSVSLVGAR